MKASLSASGLWPIPEAVDVQGSVAVAFSKAVALVSHNHTGCEFGEFWCRKIQDALESHLGQVETISSEYTEPSGHISTEILGNKLQKKVVDF